MSFQPRFHLAEEGKLVPLVFPVDFTGGKSARFNMENYHHASIVLLIGVSAAAATKIFIRAANAIAGGQTVDLPYKLYPMETTNSDVLGAPEDVLATGRTPVATDNIGYIVELESQSLPDGYSYVEVALTNGSNSVIGAAFAVLSGSRYASRSPATALA